jgi:hypothetical protein
MNKIKCDKCGSEIDGSAKFCPNCGAKIEATEKAERVEVVETVIRNNNTINTTTEAGYNALAIIGFILAFIPKIWVISLIISIIALVQISKTKEKGKGLAIAGIAISSSIMIIGLFAVILAMSVGFFRWLF